MGRPRILPNEENCSLEELEGAVKSCVSAEEKVRLLAMRAFFKGYKFEQVEELFVSSERSLERWVNEFNEQGIDGLPDRPRSGRPRIIVEQTAELKKLIETPNLADEHFWTGKKFHGYLKNELKEEISYRSTIRFLHEQGYALKVPRRWAEGQDEELRKAYLERLSVLQADPERELWYLDES